jgi:hypothetical protein
MLDIVDVIVWLALVVAFGYIISPFISRFAEFRSRTELTPTVFL